MFKMKNLITIFLVIAIAGVVLARPVDQTRDTIGAYTGPRNGTAQDDNIKASLDLLHVKVGATTSGTSGSTWYVDSNETTGTEDGTTWATATDTIDEAINLASAGDTILVADGHAETVVADGGIDADVAGISIIGLGNGDRRPQITLATATSADVNVDADDVLLSNLVFINGKGADLVAMVTISNDSCSIVGCEFRDGGSTNGLGAISVGAADGDSDKLLVKDCYFYLTGTSNDHAIEILKDMVGIKIINNIIFGDFDEGAIAVPAGGNACLDLEIIDNVITNQQASGLGISINGTSTTGNLVRNVIYVDTSTNAIDPGSLKALGNIVTTAGDVEATPALPVEDTATNFIGVDDNNNAAATTNVAANADGSILERLEQIDTDTSAIVADTGTDGVVLANDAVAAAKIATDAIGADEIAANAIGASEIAADAITTAELATGCISSDEVANDAIDSGAVADNTIDAATYAVAVRPIQTLVITTSNFSGNDYEVGDSPVTIGTVTGDVLVRVTAVIGTNCTSTGANGTLELGTTDSTASLLAQDIVDGLAFQVGDVWTSGAGADNDIGAIGDDWNVIGGGQDIILTIGTNSMTAGVIKFYIEYRPLSSDGAIADSAP